MKQLKMTPTTFIVGQLVTLEPLRLRSIFETDNEDILATTTLQ